MDEESQGDTGVAPVELLEMGERSVELRWCPELSLVVKLDEGQAVVGILLQAERSVHAVGRARERQQACDQESRAG